MFITVVLFHGLLLRPFKTSKIWLLSMIEEKELIDNIYDSKIQGTVGYKNCILILCNKRSTEEWSEGTATGGGIGVGYSTRLVTSSASQAGKKCPKCVLSGFLFHYENFRL